MSVSSVESLMVSSGTTPPGEKNDRCVLVLNSGSSSLKLALVEPVKGDRLLAGIAERPGSEDAVLRVAGLGASMRRKGSREALIRRLSPVCSPSSVRPSKMGCVCSVRVIAWCTVVSGLLRRRWWTTR